jgi:hypothetical protein
MTWFRRRPHVPERTGTQPYRDANTRQVDPIVEEISREFRRMQGHTVKVVDKDNEQPQRKT